MFGIGLPEFILIMALALIVVGPDKLPGLAKTVAKQILELKKAANSLKDSLQEELVEEKENLKQLTNGLEDVNASLTERDKARQQQDVEIYPAEAPGRDAVEADQESTLTDHGGSGESAATDEAAPKT